MARSIRILYRGQKGTIRKNWNWNAIKLDSAVIVTAAEFTVSHDMTLSGPKTIGRPNLGAANVYVTNIGPHGPEPVGGVEFLLHVDNTQPLDVIVTITVVEDIEIFEQP